MSQHSDNETTTTSPPAEELLVHGRSKRATAGNRLRFLLQHIEDEDVRNDLLAEDETDLQDYQLSDAEDVAFGSSDDSDDEGPPKDGQDEDLTGEKELQKHERLEARKKKRKAADITKINPLQKRQRIGVPNSLLAPRPRKKSERISWLPTADDAPTRQSNRRQTVANKEQTEAKLQESQKRSEKAHELLKIAAERKAARAVPALTQADRMARALKVEKENSKSLNRWEKAEEERQLQQRLRLEALRDRQLEGPVIRYWSGAVVWEGDKIKVNRVHQPKIEPVVEKPKAPKPSVEESTKQVAPDAAAVAGENHVATATATDQTPKPEGETKVENVGNQADSVTFDTAEKDAQPPDASATSPVQPTEPIPSAEEAEKSLLQEAKQFTEETTQNDASTPMDVEKDKNSVDTTTPMDNDKEKDSTVTVAQMEVDKEKDSTVEETAMDVDKEKKDTVPPAEPASFLDGIHFWASQSPDAQAPKKDTVPPVEPPTTAEAQADEATKRDQQPQREQEQQPITQPVTTLSSAGPSNAPSPSTASSAMPPPSELQAQQQPLPPQPPPPQTSSEPQQPSEPQPPPIPLIREQAQRSLIILEAFPSLDPTLSSSLPTSSSKKSSSSTTSSTAISTILTPLSHPPLTPQEHKYLTSKSKRKDIIPAPPAKLQDPVTGKVARFRDPRSGIGYSGTLGYGLLKKAVEGKVEWRNGWDCWMGGTKAAKGVPECFFTGEVEKKEGEEVAKGGEGKTEKKMDTGKGVKVEEGDGNKAQGQDVPAVDASASAPASGPASTA